MPYPGVPDSLIPKMERCVNSVMKTGKEKSNAIAICKSSIMKGEEAPNMEAVKIMELEGLTYDEAELSYQARKDLPDSAFCGPDRSYPAHDLPHARNALARVSQFGSPALQARVRACVYRKHPELKKDNEDLIIQSNISELKIDEEKGTLEAVALTVGLSANKRFYSDSIVKKVSEQMTGLKSYADHGEGLFSGGRGIKDIIGKIISSRYEEGKAIGIWQLSKSKSTREEILPKIKEGLITDVSIRASGSMRAMKMGEENVQEVTDIKVNSVDFVTEGGVEGAKIIRVFEAKNMPTLQNIENKEVKEIMTIDELKQAYPELVAEIEKPLTALKTSNEALTKENDEFKAKIKEKEIADLRTKLLGEVKESEEVKALIASKIIGSTEVELKKSIDEQVAFITKVKEANAKVTGNPPVIIEGKKKYTSSEQILNDPELSQEKKGELISKLWFS